MEFLRDAWEWVSGHFSELGLLKIYIGVASAGGAVLIGQAGLNLFGLGGDTDIDADVDADELDAHDGASSFLSVRALASFLTLFGLVGWMGTAAGWGNGVTVLAAFAAGSSVMALVAYLLNVFRRLQSHGNVQPSGAVGATAKVYLRIPAKGAGKGKVTVVLQGRSMEFDAVSNGGELATGSDCRIVGMTTSDTYRVEPLS